MIGVQTAEVLTRHPLLAVERPAGQRMVVDDVGDQAPLVREQAIVPLDEREFLRRQALLLRLRMVRANQKEALTVQLFRLELSSLVLL